jgi:hypothetical protein
VLKNTRDATTRQIGGFSVHRMGFGAMRLTGDGIWGEPKDVHQARRVLTLAVDLGVTFIDTADSYGPEVSERLIGDALSDSSAAVVIATKAGLTRQGPDEWKAVGRPEYLVQQVEMSLRRLKRDTLDLWQLHRIDPLVPLAQSLEPIARLQEQGKIRISNATPRRRCRHTFRRGRRPGCLKNRSCSAVSMLPTRSIRACSIYGCGSCIASTEACCGCRNSTAMRLPISGARRRSATSIRID